MAMYKEKGRFGIVYSMQFGDAYLFAWNTLKPQEIQSAIPYNYTNLHNLAEGNQQCGEGKHRIGRVCMALKKLPAEKLPQ